MPYAMGKNYTRTFARMKELTGFNFDDEYNSKKYRVFINHPFTPSGFSCYPDVIGWAAEDRWPNYTTVYLWHELMHHNVEFCRECFQGRRNDEAWRRLNHAVIQLLTDSELRVCFNGGSYHPWEGHPNLHKTMELLLPEWRKYLTSENKNIYAFVDRMEGLFYDKIVEFINQEKSSVATKG